MTHRLIVRPEAEADITAAAVWYDERRPKLGDDFLSEVEVALASAVLNPRQYPRIRRKPEVRRTLTARFPYRIFFVLTPEAVIVFRVLHAARHDREWKRNVPKP